MGDIFWDSINGEKEDVIDRLHEFCDMMNIECPELTTKMRLDVLRDKSNEVRSNFWSQYKKSKEEAKMNSTRVVEEANELDIKDCMPPARDIVIIGEVSGEEAAEAIKLMGKENIDTHFSKH